MGLGDELMCTGEARKAHAASGHRVVVVGLDGRPRWSPVFEHNPIIVRSRQRDSMPLLNGPNARPYIASKTPTRWTWRPYRPLPGVVHLTPFEEAEALRFAGRIVIEPNVKRNGHENKAWPWERWQAVVDAFPAGTFVQCIPPVPTRRLERVEFAMTLDFRAACAVMAVGCGFVGSEGGMHHAAAAFDKPAVVLWAEFIAPEFTGYDTQCNVRHAVDTCGSRLPCKGCEESMLAITVDEVAANVQSMAGEVRT